MNSDTLHLGTGSALTLFMCKKKDCVIYESCHKDDEQSLYCRKIELLVHLSKEGKMPTPRVNYVRLPDIPVLM